MRVIKAVLIIGGSGFLGTHLAQKLRQGYKVFATYHKNRFSLPGVTFLPVNLANRNWIRRVLIMARPDVIVYLAGKNDPNWVEKNSPWAEHVHAIGPAILSGLTDILQPRFIYVSNSYVFDGSKGNYHEVDTVLPECTLGRVKLNGENVVKSKCLNYIILRSSPLLGRGNGINFSFFDRMRMSLDRKIRFVANNQELHSYGLVDGFCDVIQRLIESGVKNRVIHYGGLTKITEYELAREFSKRFKYDPALVSVSDRPNKKSAKNSLSQLDFSLNSSEAVEILEAKPLLLEQCFDLIEKQLVFSS